MKKKGLLSVRIPGLSKTVEEKPATKPCLNVDYPQQGETVRRGHYAVRISGGNGESQVAVNEGKWEPCRLDGGFHWYDWYPEQTGSHRLLVRTRIGSKWVKTERVCDVE